MYYHILKIVTSRGGVWIEILVLEILLSVHVTSTGDVWVEIINVFIIRTSFKLHSVGNVWVEI